MDAIECIKGRRSVRKFSEQAVSHELIAEIVEAARFAPSWKNTQTTRFNIVENTEVKNELAQNAVCGFTFNTKTITRCPVLVVVSTVTGISGFEPDGSYSTPKEDRWQNFDAGVATQTFCLAAHEKGLGTVILGVFDDEKVAGIVSLPEGEVPTALIAVGWPAAPLNAAPPRKEVGELLRFL